MCCGCCSVRQQKIWVFTIGGLLTVVGVIMITAWPTMSDKLIESMITLAPNSVMFNKWVATPLPLFMTFYLYNWTNPEEVNNTKVKPHFEELGPYAFRDYKIKQDLHWDNDKNTVTFFGHRTWWFDPAKSQGSMDDLITMPHFPSMTAAKFSQDMHPIIRKIVNFALNREGGRMTMTHSVIVIIFNGYDDDLLDMAYRLHSPLVPLDDNRFAWMYKRNNTKEAEGTYTVHTGKGDLTQMGDLKMWNGSEYTGHWDGECGRVNGTMGDLWAPHKHWDDPVSIYLFEAGRYFNLFAQKDVTYHGMEARRYESTDQTFDSGYIAADTACFCVKGRECPKNGVVDFSPMAYGGPVYLSHRHFYMSDPMYRENTTSFNPDPEKHGIYAVVEPKWGIPLDLNGQVLISINMEQHEMIDIFKDVAYNFYAPMVDVQIKVEINDELLRLAKLLLNLPSIGQYIGIAFTVIGIVMIAVGIYVTKKHKWRGDVYPPKIEDTKS